jgi:hypothetical protein
MLKPLLFVLVIVILLSGALHFELFKNEVILPATTTQSLQKESINHNFSKDEIESLTIEADISIDNNLSKELTELLNKAHKLYTNNEYSELHLLYDKIIEKSKDAKDPSVLKVFARASLDKARLYYTYPNYDSESAIELYELITQKLATRDERELMLLYLDAKLQQTQFISKEESIETYSQLIEKFQNDPEQRFSKMVDELLFSKSFALMGLNDEEAMEVFDTLISKYDITKELPDSAKFAIFNNIELSIITNNSPDEYVDMAKEYMPNSVDTKPLLEMLEIINNAQDMPQEESLERWFEEHKEYKLSDWSFSELRKWVNNMEQPEAQLRIKNYLDLFEQHKFKNYNQVPSVPIQPHTEQTLRTQTQEVEEIAPIDLPVNVKAQSTEPEDVIDNEADPYLNDIYLPEPDVVYEEYNSSYPLSYPDPYATEAEPYDNPYSDSEAID